MSALICGSIAFDVIMVFNDRFKNHILPEQIHRLNVAFLVPELRREFGGCAGNIAYTLHLLEEKGWPLGAVGSDFTPYQQWFNRQGIAQNYVQIFDDVMTAQAYITTDLDDNQITAFHPGAMNYTQQVRIPQDRAFDLAIVAPENRDGMLAHGQQLAQAGIPFIFDPGQAISQLDGDDLRQLIGQADWVVANDYEFELIQQRTQWQAEDIAQQVQALIVTLGAKGSCIYQAGQSPLVIPCAPADAVVDPTGCGDAYRAGLIKGLLNGYDWPTIGRIASLCGALKIAHGGTQNHRFTLAEFGQRYQQAFGESLPD